MGDLRGVLPRYVRRELEKAERLVSDEDVVQRRRDHAERRVEELRNCLQRWGLYDVGPWGVPCSARCDGHPRSP